ncbi:EIN3-binding F-box protein 2-like protein [Tanacetum coccineum]
MPALVNYSGDDKYHKGGSLCSMDSSRSFSALDVYSRPSKRTRISDSHSLFANEEKNPSIEILPDECLYEIFRHLSSGQARSASACVSKHWLTLLSDVRSSEIVSNKVDSESSNGDELENDGYLTRSLEGKKATDTRLAAIAVGTSARGGLGKLSVRGSDKVTSIGFRTVARGCPSLKVLSLWNVPLIGDEALIEVSKECHLLESLDLSQCPSISDVGLASIAENCPNLCSITLESCKNIGNKSLQAIARNCTNLQSISIKECPLIGDRGIATLCSSSSVLTKVKLQALNITDLSLAVIGRYGKSITSLALTSLPNMTPKGFWAMGNAKGLESLMSLTVTWCYGITDISLVAIGHGCRVLKHMTLKKCCFVSDKGLVSFTKAARYLESLQLEECNRITQHGILGTLSNQSSKLTSFSLVKCMGIKDLVQEPVDFSESQSLRSLTIKNCIGFGNSNLATITKLCPNLHNLDLTGLCGINDTGLYEFLKTCKVGLVKVNLSDCINLTNKVVVTLAEIHGGSLEMLNLDGCKKISDESLAAIAENCLFLKDLDVSKCCITDSGVSCLSNVGHMNLRVLSLSGCSRVSNESVLSLEKLGHTLVGLNLQGCNMISSSVIESLVVNLWRCDILS